MVRRTEPLPWQALEVNYLNLCTATGRLSYCGMQETVAARECGPAEAAVTKVLVYQLMGVGAIDGPGGSLDEPAPGDNVSDSG